MIMFEGLRKAWSESKVAYVDGDEMSHFDLANNGPEEDFSRIRAQAEALCNGDVIDRFRSDDPVIREQVVRNFGSIVGPILAEKGILVEYGN